MGTRANVPAPAVKTRRFTPAEAGEVRPLLAASGLEASTDSPASVADRGWAKQRRARILDRVEFPQFQVGLRYLGPPIWLKVGTTGPDAESLAADSDHSPSWDWQSSVPDEIEDLADRGADDTCLVAAVGRYAIENLVVNAVHQIGESFRFDGRRLFPAHTGGLASEQHGHRDGAVTIKVSFNPPSEPAAAEPVVAEPDEIGRHRLLRQLARIAAPSRFTYLPGTTIAYEPVGPVIRTVDGEAPVTTWRSTWSSATAAAASADPHRTMASVAQDVHTALVQAATDRICRDFYIDGARPWRLSCSAPPFGRAPLGSDATGQDALFVVLDYGSIADTEPRISNEYEDQPFMPMAVASFGREGNDELD